MNEREYNGVGLDGIDEQELQELTERDTERVAARTPAPIVVSEAATPSTFEQQTHTLMTESIDRIAQGWIGQLKHIRNNTQVLEKMVLQACAKAQHDITELHLLGAQVTKEAERGEQVCEQLGKQLDKILHETRVQ